MAKNFGSLLFLVFSVTFSILNNTVSTSSLKSRSRFSSSSANSPVNTNFPSWFKANPAGPSETSWNIFGQWFNQVNSKPIGKVAFLKSVDNVEEFWSFISPATIESVGRVDISLFRPGVPMDFSKFVSHESGYILSYRLELNSSAEPSPSKFSRNKAKKLQEAGMLSGRDHLAHYHFFDSILSTAMTVGSGSIDPFTVFFAEIMGFTIKKQFKDLFIQIFIDGSQVRRADAEESISNMISASYPECVLGAARKYNLASYSHKLSSPKGSPAKKSPSRIVTIVRTSDSEEENNKLVKCAASSSSENEDEEEEQVVELQTTQEIEKQPVQTPTVHERKLEGFFSSNSEDSNINEEFLELVVSNEEESSSDDGDSDDFVETTQISQTKRPATLDDIIDDYLDDEDISTFISSKTSPISGRSAIPSHTDEQLVPHMPMLIRDILPNPIPIRSLEDELFEFIFTASADLFRKDPDTIYDHFEKVYLKLKANRSAAQL